MGRLTLATMGVAAVLCSLSTHAVAAPADLDTTFSADGKQTLDLGKTERIGSPQETAIDSSGRVLVAGMTAKFAGSNFDDHVYVARYTATGVLDTTFGDEGFFTRPSANNDQPIGMAVDSLGRIVVATRRSGFGAFRLTTNGTLDEAFGDDGSAGGPLTGSAAAEDMVLDASNRPVIVGTDSAFGDGVFAVARLTTGGTPDTTFSGDGFTTLPGQSGFLRGVAINETGQILATGSVGTQGLVVRFAANGTIAASGFGGGDGIAEVPVGGNTQFFPMSISVGNGVGTHAGKPVIGGRVEDASTTGVAVARLNADGTPDTNTDGVPTTHFGGDGLVELEPSIGDFIDGKVTNLLALPSGVVTLGGGVYQGGYDLFAARLTDTGAFDGTYGGGDGFQFAPMNPDASEEPFGAAFGADGSTVVVGGTFSQAIARFLPAGTLNNGFDGDGVVAGPLLFDGTDRFNAVVRDGSGRYVAVGTSDAESDVFQTEPKLLVARYLANGNPDTSFSGDGRAFVEYDPELAYGPRALEATDVAIDSTGRIVIVSRDTGLTIDGGYVEGGFNVLVTRLTSAGELDEDFQSSGGVADPPGFVSLGLYRGNHPADVDPSLAVDSQDRIIVGTSTRPPGNAPSDLMVFRIATSGALDGTFGGDIDTFPGPDGYVVTDLGGTNEVVTDVAIAGGDKIVAVGRSDNQLAVAQYTTAGALDPAFSAPGTPGYDIRSTNFGRPSVAVNGTDGKITVAGSGGGSGLLTRYTSAGAVDSAFTAGSAGIKSFQSNLDPPLSNALEVGDVALDPFGRAIVGGVAYRGVNSDGAFGDLFVARFTLSGEVSATFDPGNGLRAVDFGGNEAPAQESEIVPQADLAITPGTGQIVVSGKTKLPNGETDAVLARLVGGTDADVTQRTLTVSTAGGGSSTGTVTGPGITCIHGSDPGDCSETYADGEMITLTASGTGGSTFTGWSGACTGTGTCNLTMSADRAVTATFADPVSTPRTLTVTAPTNGSIEGTGIDCPGDCTETYPTGTLVTLDAVADPGYEFGSWTGACASDPDDSCEVTMSANRSVGASFSAAGSFDVTVDLDGTGTGSVTGTNGFSCPATACSKSYAPGTTVTLNASPASGSTFVGWSGDCTGTGSCVVVTSEDQFVTATFAPIAAGAPNTTITQAKINSKRRKATFGFTGSGGEGALTFECKLDGGRYADCTTPKTYKRLTRKKHSFFVRAVDATGAEDPTPAKKAFKIARG